jgi:hypothetical protein
MLHRVLVTILTLVTAVGPGLCCCSFAAHRPTPANTPTAKPANAARPCCCCQHEEDADEPAAPQAAAAVTPAQPTVPDQECPCKKLRERMPSLHSLSAEGATPDQSRSALPDTWLPVAAFSDTAPAPVIVHGGDPPLPFLTAQDLLRTHHLLRC